MQLDTGKSQGLVGTLSSIVKQEGYASHCYSTFSTWQQFSTSVGRLYRGNSQFSAKNRPISHSRLHKVSFLPFYSKPLSVLSNCTFNRNPSMNGESLILTRECADKAPPMIFGENITSIGQAKAKWRRACRFLQVAVLVLRCVGVSKNYSWSDTRE